MKNIILLTLTLTLLLTSCDRNITTEDPININGTWFMKSYDTFADDFDLTEAYILWKIDNTTNTIEIINYYTDYQLPYPSGIYQFTRTDNQINIQINAVVERFVISIAGDNISLSSVLETDGSVLSFEHKDTICLESPLEDIQWLHTIKTSFDITVPALTHKIIQYEYNMDCVYLISECDGCADAQTLVYNMEGDVICTFGGFSGENTCPNFFDNASKKRFLYNK